MIWWWQYSLHGVQRTSSGGNPISFPHAKLSVDEDYVGSGDDTYSNKKNIMIPSITSWRRPSSPHIFSIRMRSALPDSLHTTRGALYVQVSKVYASSKTTVFVVDLVRVKKLEVVCRDMCIKHSVKMKIILCSVSGCPD